MNPLTTRQFETLSMIADYIRQNGFPPSFREIAKHAGTELNAVAGHLRALEKKGYISRVAGRARSLRILKKPRKAIAG